MTPNDHPLPTSGGSFMRNEDGSLTRVNEEGQPIDEAGDIIASAPAEAAIAKPGRAARTVDPALTEKDV
ncbi:MAG: hypothetical protein JWS10_929 [Cypionkella sp.]|uniref:hypothetical protein n=1 Tax=Cypionkella sp. TaxID=2811411 RepID=UPI00261BE828|nr:hypothetical protein [Cypionkella sp.]MDB5658314.1 hypothetical protein [Cypionkella sp.]